MAWTTDDLSKLKAAIASGASEVEYSTGKVVYRSLDQMLQIKAMMERELNINNNASKRSTPKTSKGL